MLSSAVFKLIDQKCICSSANSPNKWTGNFRTVLDILEWLSETLKHKVMVTISVANMLL